MVMSKFLHQFSKWILLFHLWFCFQSALSTKKNKTCCFVLFCSWWFNPGVLTIVETDDMDIEEGDFVVISNSEELVKEKQKGHGGWNPAMEKVCCVGMEVCHS